MRRMRFNRHTDFRGFDDDVGIIVRSLARNGVEITPEDAFLAWQHVSESMCAGWLILPRLSAETAAEMREGDVVRMPDDDESKIFDASEITREVMRFLVDTTECGCSGL